MKTSLLTTTLALMLTQAASAAPGDLDTSFNALGYAVDTSHVQPRADGVCIDAAGRIAVAGSRQAGSSAGQWQTLLGRYSSTGALDLGFGWKTLGFPAPINQIPSMLCTGNSYAVTSLDQISGSNYGVRLDIVPINPGSWSSFWLGGQGLVNSNPRVALAAPIANRFLVGPSTGAPGSRTATLQRWDGDGFPSLSFQASWTGPTGSVSQYTEAYTDANGNTFVVGRRAGSGTQGMDAMVSSFNSSGVLRSSFGTGGTLSIATAADDYGQRITASAFNGWSYVGITEIPSSGNPRVRVLRILSNGTVDTGYNGNGVLTLDAELGDIIEDGQGRLLVVGNKVGGAAFIRRLLSNGNLDTTFGGGERVYAFGSLTARFGGVALDGQGRIVLVGHRDSAQRGGNTVPEALIVARLLP
ncbi:MAG: hypothetical protein U1F26_08815 [Lysobacterales bacterium]